MFKTATQPSQVFDQLIVGFRKKERSNASLEDTLVQHKHLIVKIASSKMEKLAVFRLRKKIFSKEYNLKHSLSPFDFDRYDLRAKHLIIKDTQSGQIVGCYRMILSNSSKDLYSSTEFDTKSLNHLDGKLAELSRACIDEHYRNGITLNLLWTGLYRYCRQESVRYLVGIPSLEVKSPHIAESVFQSFQQQGLVDNKPEIEPLLAYHTVQDLEETELEQKEIKKLIPPLMRVYFKAGAKVCSRGAYDPKFNSLDFFTLLDFENLSEKFKARYQ